MQKFWAWLGLNLGKRAGVVSIVGLRDHGRRWGSASPKLEFATGQDSYLNKDEDDLQEQRRLPGPLRRPGDGHARHPRRRQRPHRRCSRRRTSSSGRQVEAELKEQGGDQIFGVVTPLTALAVHQRPRADPETREPSRRAWRPRSSSAPPSRRPHRGGQGGAQRVDRR